MSDVFEGGGAKQADNQEESSAEWRYPLTETAIHNFLKVNGVKKKGVSSVREGQSLLCVLPPMVRTNTGPYKHLDPKERPSIARIDFPVRYKDGMKIICTGQVDYYALIDGVPVHMKTSQHEQEREYITMPRELYEAADRLFPKTELSKQPE